MSLHDTVLVGRVLDAYDRLVEDVGFTLSMAGMPREMRAHIQQCLAIHTPTFKDTSKLQQELDDLVAALIPLYKALEEQKIPGFVGMPHDIVVSQLDKQKQERIYWLSVTAKVDGPNQAKARELLAGTWYEDEEP